MNFSIRNKIIHHNSASSLKNCSIKETTFVLTDKSGFFYGAEDGI